MVRPVPPEKMSRLQLYDTLVRTPSYDLHGRPRSELEWPDPMKSTVRVWHQVLMRIKKKESTRAAAAAVERERDAVEGSSGNGSRSGH